jgi:3'-5' exoribonuclease
MIIELEMLQAKLAKLPDFPPDLKTLLEHLIISHHGQYDFGSPKLPMFPEALMLHYLDDLDSKMEAMRAQFEREAELDGPWTSYNASLGRPLLDSRKFLQGEKTPAARTGGEESVDLPATTSMAETATPAAPLLDLFSEQKA